MPRGARLKSLLMCMQRALTPTDISTKFSSRCHPMHQRDDKGKAKFKEGFNDNCKIGVFECHTGSFVDSNIFSWHHLRTTWNPSLCLSVFTFSNKKITIWPFVILFLHTAAYQGDRQCDDKNNNCGCDWDGGDCCGSSAGVSYCSQCKCLDPDYDGTKCKRTSLNEHLLSGQTPTDQYFIRVECILHINLYFEIRCTEPPLLSLSVHILYIAYLCLS